MSLWADITLSLPCLGRASGDPQGGGGGGPCAAVSALRRLLCATQYTQRQKTVAGGQRSVRTKLLGRERDQTRTSGFQECGARAEP